MYVVVCMYICMLIEEETGQKKTESLIQIYRDRDIDRQDINYQIHTYIHTYIHTNNSNTLDSICHRHRHRHIHTHTHTHTQIHSLFPASLRTFP